MSETKLTRDQIIEALWRCTFLDADGYLMSKCNGCPMKDKEWVEEGKAACRSFEELNVDIPYELAERVMKLLQKEENAE